MKNSLGVYLNITLDSMQLPGWQGLSLPLLRSSAYTSIINSGILKDVPLETASALARVYNFQNIIERFDDNLLSAAAQANDINSIERIRFFFGTYSEIFPELMAVYQLMLKDGILKEKVEKYMY